jgi:hypothetical protein
VEPIDTGRGPKPEGGARSGASRTDPCDCNDDDEYDNEYDDNEKERT